MSAIATIPGTASGFRPAGWAGPALLGCSLFAGLMVLAGHLLKDPDSHWHVALGARIWRDGAVPWADDYSHTLTGAPWIAKEWLGQLLLYAAHAAFGWRGMVALTAAILAATVALLFGWLRSRVRGTVALATAILAAVFLAPHFLARPLVFGLLALLVWTAGLAAARERDRAPPPWLLLVLVAWANLHGSFTIACPVLGIVAAEAVCAAPVQRRLAALRDWAAFAAASALAAVATPYGWAASRITSTLLGHGEAMALIREWQPLAFDAAGWLMVASAVALVAGLAAEPVRNVWRILAVAGLAAATLRYGRVIDAYALVAPILSAGPLARRFKALRPETASPTGETSSRRPTFGVAPGVLVASGLLLIVIRPPEPDPAVTPRAALAAARRAGADGPVYNSYDFGGFLIAEGVPTFIDGRTELYLGGLMEEVARVSRADTPDALFAMLDRRAVRWALLLADSPEAARLGASPAWRRVHLDRVATVFVRADAARP